MKNKASDANQAYVFELNDDVRQQLEALATDWERWIYPHRDAKEEERSVTSRACRELAGHLGGTTFFGERALSAEPEEDAVGGTRTEGVYSEPRQVARAE